MECKEQAGKVCEQGFEGSGVSPFPSTEPGAPWHVTAWLTSWGVIHLAPSPWKIGHTFPYVLTCPPSTNQTARQVGVGAWQSMGERQCRAGCWVLPSWWSCKEGKVLVVSWIWDFSNHPHTSPQPRRLALVLKEEEKEECERVAFKAWCFPAGHICCAEERLCCCSLPQGGEAGQRLSSWALKNFRVRWPV